MRFRHVKIAYNVVALLVCLSMTVYVVQHFYNSSRVIRHRPKPARLNTSKIIHLHSFPYFYELKTGGSHFKNCPVHNCVYEDSEQWVPESDAILFYTHGMQKPKAPVKQLNQIWIFFSVESPIHSNNDHYGGPEWLNKFNWTMTYLYDSDIKFGYGDILKAEGIPVRDFKPIAKRKTKLAAWFVSNCKTQSNRMEYVRLLQKYIPIDIYGKCGQLHCPRENSDDCIRMLERDYKFYLSFENSFCEDYVTEKLLQMLKRDIVPVSRSGANLTNILPTKMALSTNDFASVRDLAEYLKYLDAHLDEYVSYLTWKNSYQVVEPQPFPHCLLCERVHSAHKWSNSYVNVVDWWKTRCHEPKDIIEVLV